MKCALASHSPPRALVCMWRLCHFQHFRPNSGNVLRLTPKSPKRKPASRNASPVTALSFLHSDLKIPKTPKIEAINEQLFHFRDTSTKGNSPRSKLHATNSPPQPPRVRHLPSRQDTEEEEEDDEQIQIEGLESRFKKFTESVAFRSVEKSRPRRYGTSVFNWDLPA